VTGQEKAPAEADAPWQFKSGDFPGSTGIHLAAGPTSTICIAAIGFT